MGHLFCSMNFSMSLVSGRTIVPFVHLKHNGQIVLLQEWGDLLPMRCGSVVLDGFGIARHAKNPIPASEKVTESSSAENAVNCSKTGPWRTLNEIA
jgi:hypothetical protein